MGTVVSSLVGILVSLILGRFEFALGLVIGTIGSIFWIGWCVAGYSLVFSSLDRYRWRAVGRVRDPQTGAVVLGPTALRSAERIVADLGALRRLCPTFGPAWSLAGQLKRFVLNDPRGAELIRTARRLSPCSASACVAAGLLEAREGNLQDSLEAFRRALALDGSWFRRIVRACIWQLARPELAVEVARDDPDRLLAVAEVLKRRGQAALAPAARAGCDPAHGVIPDVLGVSGGSPIHGVLVDLGLEHDPRGIQPGDVFLLIQVVGPVTGGIGPGDHFRVGDLGLDVPGHSIDQLGHHVGTVASAAARAVGCIIRGTHETVVESFASGDGFQPAQFRYFGEQRGP